MKIFVVFCALLAGCGGARFEEGFGNEEAPDGGELDTDGGVPLEGTGGAGTGGGRSGGASAAGGRAAAGGGGRAPGAGGASSGGRAPAAGGTASAGGAPTAGGAAGTGGAAIPCDGAGISTHDTGLGVSWQDCVPVGTHDVAQASAACNAWCAEHDCFSHDPQNHCFTASCGGGSEFWFGQTVAIAGPDAVLTGWSMSSGEVVHMTVSGSCPVIGAWD